MAKIDWTKRTYRDMGSKCRLCGERIDGSLLCSCRDTPTPPTEERQMKRHRVFPKGTCHYCGGEIDAIGHCLRNCRMETEMARTIVEGTCPDCGNKLDSGGQCYGCVAPPATRPLNFSTGSGFGRSPDNATPLAIGVSDPMNRILLALERMADSLEKQQK